MIRLLLIVMLSACGVEPVSQPRAVSDERAVLGLRPVKRDRVVSYELLVCKKLTEGVYRPEMFDDDSVCRPVLLSETGEQVLFARDHVHKDRRVMAIGLGKGAVVYLGVMTLALVGGKRTVKWLRSLKLNDANKAFDKYNKALQQAQEQVSKAEEFKESVQRDYNKVIEMQEKYFKNDSVNYPNRYPIYIVRHSHYKAEQIAKKRLAKAKAQLEEAERIRDETQQLVKQIDKVRSLREQGDEKLADAQRQLIEIDQARPLNFSRKLWVAIGAGLTGVTATIINNIDDLNWGHGERQLGRYWYQVFYKSGEFNHAQQIDDLLPVIRAIASTFNYRLNDKALDLLRG